MEIEIKGGNKRANKSVVTGEYSNLEKKIPSKPIKGRDEKLSNTKIKEKAKTEEAAKNTKNEIVEDKKEAICPIEFDESLIKKDSVIINPLDRFKELVSEIENMVSENKENVKEFGEIIKSNFGNFFYEDEKPEKEESPSLEVLSKLMIKIGKMMENLKYDDSVTDSNEYKTNLELLVESTPLFLLEKMVKRLLEDYYYIGLKLERVNHLEDEEVTEIEITPQIMVTDIENGEEKSYVLFEDTLKTIFIEDKNISYFSNNNENSEESSYGKCKFWAGKVINVKDLFEDEQPGKIIALIDEDGNYVTTGEENNIMAIDMIDDRSVQSSSIVSTQWLNETLEELAKYSADKSEVKEEKVEIPTGVLPPTEEIKSVNGVPVEGEY